MSETYYALVNTSSHGAEDDPVVTLFDTESLAYEAAVEWMAEHAAAELAEIQAAGNRTPQEIVEAFTEYLGASEWFGVYPVSNKTGKHEIRSTK